MYKGMGTWTPRDGLLLVVLWIRFTCDELDEVMDTSLELIDFFGSSFSIGVNNVPWRGKKDVPGLQLSGASFGFHPKGVDIQHFKQFMELAEVSSDVIEDDGTVTIVTFPPLEVDWSVRLVFGDSGYVQRLSNTGRSIDTGDVNGVGGHGPRLLILCMGFHKSD